MKTLELFAGAGGLALGSSAAGLRHAGVIEWNEDACNTIRYNQGRRLVPTTHWPLVQADVHSLDFREWEGIQIVTGGPPCQPFSIGGKHKGREDHRNLFPQAVRAVRETKPLAFVFENVRGLVRSSFSEYFEYIILQLTYPELTMPRGMNDWRAHRTKLERHHTKGGRESGLTYRVVFRVLNAADYGVPQKRFRVFIVGFRSDVKRSWSFPEPTHSALGLTQSKLTGHYWEKWRVPKRERDLDFGRGNSCQREFEISLKPWRTVREALDGLPEPTDREADGFHNHVLQHGARVYPGHTGSPLDEPAKTLKAGDHGVPGGENMLRRPNGTVRYFSVRESARLQTFPDDYVFGSAWSENMRQLGNAVPVDLARIVVGSVANCLDEFPRMQ